MKYFYMKYYQNPSMFTLILIFIYNLFFQYYYKYFIIYLNSYLYSLYEIINNININTSDSIFNNNK